MKLTAIVLLAALFTGPGTVKPKPVYLGCGPYCRQAGDFGAEAAPLAPAHFVGTSLHLADDMLPVTISCTYVRTCRGAMVIYHYDRDFQTLELGGSDVVVAPGTTLTIGVRMSPEGGRRLRHDGKLYAEIIGALGDPECPDDTRYDCLIGTDVAAYAN